MKALIGFIVFLFTGRTLPLDGRNRGKGVDDSRQYDQAIEMAGNVEPQLRTIYSRDPLDVYWDKLTHRQQDVVALICLGQRNHDIAKLLGIAPGTVKGYIEDILPKLKARNRTDIRLMYQNWDFQTWWMNRQISMNNNDHAHR